MVWGIFKELWIHHNYLIPEHFFHLNLKACTHQQSLPLTSSPWQPLIWFLILWICLFWTFHINGVIEYIVICIWLLSHRMFNIHSCCDVCQPREAWHDVQGATWEESQGISLPQQAGSWESKDVWANVFIGDLDGAQAKGTKGFHWFIWRPQGHSQGGREAEPVTGTSLTALCAWSPGRCSWPARGDAEPSGK